MFCVCRNGWYHFKLRIPCDLTDIVGRSVIQYPLRVRKKREANRMALELRDRLTPQFQRLRIERLSLADDDGSPEFFPEWDMGGTHKMRWVIFI